MYRDELTVTYDAPKPQKKVFTQVDLFNADKFSFGSAIGSITNKGTNAYALLPVIEKKYGRESEEYKILLSRLQQCCVAQSKQIDMYMSPCTVMCIDNVVNLQMQGVQPTQWGREEMPVEAVLTGNA